MVEFFNKKKHYGDLIEFISENFDGDFYIEKNDRRIFINNVYSLKQFISSYSNILICKDEGRISGVLGICSLKVLNGKRRYIKMNSFDRGSGDKLLSVLFWNTNDNYFIQLNKLSKFTNLLRSKQFKFFGGRGNEILLRRNKWQLPYRPLNR